MHTCKYLISSNAGLILSSSAHIQFFSDLFSVLLSAVDLSADFVRIRIKANENLESAAYHVVSGLPREDGPGLGLGEREVFQIGLVQMPGQSPQICCLRVHVLHVR